MRLDDEVLSAFVPLSFTVARLSVQCAASANMRLTRHNGSVRCETVWREIVNSVRIEPLQPTFPSFERLANTLQPSGFVPEYFCLGQTSHVTGG